MFAWNLQCCIATLRPFVSVSSFRQIRVSTIDPSFQRELLVAAHAALPRYSLVAIAGLHAIAIVLPKYRVRGGERWSSPRRSALQLRRRIKRERREEAKKSSSMGNGPSNRRNSRSSQQQQPHPRVGSPPHGGVLPIAGSSGPASLGPYFYSPSYHGPLPAAMGPQIYQQGFMPSNGQYMMNVPPPGYRPVSPVGVSPQIPGSATAAAAIPVAHHQKANTIRNDVNLRKATLRIEKDEENPGFYLVAFSFDATVPGNICIFFVAKEGVNCSLTPMKPQVFDPVKVPFDKGLGQKFRQAPGTGIDLSLFEDEDLAHEGQDETYALVVRAETYSRDPPADAPSRDTEPLGAPLPKWVHSQTTHAVVERKDGGEYGVRVIKQIIWVEGVRYELQEIYGIENSGGGSGANFDDSGKECVICMSEPRDTTVLPCRHMCMCSECAKVLRFQTNRCPICRCPVERLLEIKVPKNDAEQQSKEPVESSYRTSASKSEEDSDERGGGDASAEVPAPAPAPTENTCDSSTREGEATSKPHDTRS
ncbi:probable E3 ubiquitin-protein ligase LUL2 [Selaginella moellendorffii]|nr:probable E3 ubiquitin-protein ligase LUL2 [Selaginella moellendorffii]|eukprot:XP_002982812.2 probable E3 ubiquitin-protein ligase LUL2 [Selaginella moellendorffii]